MTAQKKELVLSRDIMWRDLDSEGIVLNLQTSEYFKLNGSALFIMRALARYGKFDSGTIEASARSLSSHYEIPLGEAQLDTHEFVNHLEEQRIIVAPPKTVV